MEKILQLSIAEENFTVKPTSPILQKIEFSFQDFVPVVLRLLQLDSNLARIHAKISPKMNEELFWRNYYLRVIYLRAKSGIDGPEAEASYKDVVEDGLIFGLHTVSSPSANKSSSSNMASSTSLDSSGINISSSKGNLSYQSPPPAYNTVRIPSSSVISPISPPADNSVSPKYVDTALSPKYVEHSYEEDTVDLGDDLSYNMDLLDEEVKKCL